MAEQENNRESVKENIETIRLKSRKDNKGWKRWGPYLSERQWGTVREDYSNNGDAWGHLSHDAARSRTYRWGEDGIGGISDNKQHICFSLAFWNHQDSIIKERLFGLTGTEGSHAEDVKELYYYLDNTPTHSYMKMLYKYPQKRFPYSTIVEEDRKRGRKEKEYEIIDTGVFDNDNYFDIFIEYAKADENDILIKITAHNRSEKKAPLIILPTIWCRNTWSWGYEKYAKKPKISRLSNHQIEVEHPIFPDAFKLYCENPNELAFCDNETNVERFGGTADEDAYPKDAINNYIVQGDKKFINPKQTGTKASAIYRKNIPAQSSHIIRLRLSSKAHTNKPFDYFDDIFAQRMQEADEFYADVQKNVTSEELAKIQRQAFAGMLWNKQFYYYNVNEWLNGDPKMGFKFKGRGDNPKNKAWKHAYMANILSMPDKWEYPWFAAWDLAFHTVTLSRLDPDFAKRQLSVVLREYYMHPNGQIPAYEWNFSDVNPPVHAWATWKVYEIDKERNGGKGDIDFLERIYHKLLLNFTWWVNQKDGDGNNIFGGGFLGLDNIGVFDRNAQIPGMTLQQADATGWMAMYTLNMLRIACEISLTRPVYQDTASKFFEHFLHIAAAINHSMQGGAGLWDDEDKFYYDKMHGSNNDTIFMKIRSLVGLIPLCAVEVITEDLLCKLPDFRRRLEWVRENRPDLTALISQWDESSQTHTHLLALMDEDRMKKVLNYLFDEKEFLSDYGIRSLSKYHLENPYGLPLNDQYLTVPYTPGESDMTMMGGNSNWRGPIWFPINVLIIDSLLKFHEHYGNDYEVEYPANSGNMTTLQKAAFSISNRLVDLFRYNEEGKRAGMNLYKKFDEDKHFKDYHLFYEYFHGDTGEGLGASHQTGWTGLVADLIELISRFNAVNSTVMQSESLHSPQ